MPFEKRCSLDARREFSLRFVFLRQGFQKWDKDLTVTTRHKAANEDFTFNWEKKKTFNVHSADIREESYSFGDKLLYHISLRLSW